MQDLKPEACLSISILYMSELLPDPLSRADVSTSRQLLHADKQLLPQPLRYCLGAIQCQFHHLRKCKLFK